MQIFNLTWIDRVRRNHGFEHATIHILSKKYSNLSIVGRSDWNGFTLYGTVDTADVKAAAEEALRRLRRGEGDLAVHPRCGTMLATTGLLTGLAAFFAIALDSNNPQHRFRWAAIPAAILGATFAAIFAQPVGLFLQENYTVSSNPGTLAIKQINRQSDVGLTIHRVETTQ